MRTLDFTPLLRSGVGFDDLFGLAETLTRRNGGSETGYPPYDIERTDENNGETGYRITMALAGFSEDELEVTVKDDTLLIESRLGKDGEEKEEERTFLHRGIARRAFSRRFRLAETIRVTGARFENGLLDIELVREIPEHAKPRRIEIGGGNAAIEKSKAA